MQNNVLNVKVFNSGSKSVDKLPLKLYLDGIQSSTSSVNISPNSFSKAIFNFTVKERGVHKAKIEFDDQPITFDNQYFFVLNASPTIRVLHLFNQKSSQNYLSKMYANDSLFNYSSYSIGNVDPEQIKNADFVILEGISTIESQIKISLESFLNSGGNVFISPSENPVSTSLQTFLNQYGIQNLTVNNELPDPKKFIDISEPIKSNPFYEDVFEKGTFNSIVSLPNGQAILQWNGIGEKLLTYKNGENFLTQTKVGDGAIYLLATPLNPKFGNFAEHAFFVPTFYKMAYLSSKADKLAYNFNDTNLSFFMPNSPKNASYKLKSDKLELIPVQRLNGKTLILELPKSSELTDGQLYDSGYFDLIIDGKTLKTIALNHDDKESKLNVYSEDELKEIFENQKNITIYNDVSDGNFVNAFRDTTMAKPLWKYFIIASLLFLFVEIVLVKFMKS